MLLTSKSLKNIEVSNMEKKCPVCGTSNPYSEYTEEGIIRNYA